MEKGLPRNRFFHNCIGISDENVYILQREGTVEEVANWLKDAGARDGIILDNGGCVLLGMEEGPFQQNGYPKGGILFSAPDFRAPSSAVVVFVLKGPAATCLPGGSVSYAVL